MEPAESHPWSAVVVSGAPAAGKSTVAAALAAGLGLPLLSLDVVKEALADSLGLGDEAWSDQLGDAAAEVVFSLASLFPSVVEGWWRRERRDRALVEFRGCIEVFCHAAPKVVEARARRRLLEHRHPIHRDVINPTLLDSLAQVAAEVPPLGVGRALIRIETRQTQDLEWLCREVRGLLIPTQNP